jgi:hypothetical protein
MVKQAGLLKDFIAGPAELRSPSRTRVWCLFGAGVFTIDKGVSVYISGDVEDTVLARLG